VIEAAYNDSAGVTAKFNKNLLARINRELGADFNLAHWQHYAVYDPAEGRIEIYLLSETNQTVKIGDRAFQFRAGEKILTEYSYKHTIGGFITLARQAGFHFEQVWTDDARWFGVFYFTVAN
jgi:L-histidine N-alpha-methyltransferase